MHFTAQEEMELAGLLGLKMNGVVASLGVRVPADESRLAFRSEMEANWPETRYKKGVIFFGRLILKKGLDLLVRAFAEVARRCSDLHLLVAGPDQDGYGEEMRRWIAKEGITDRVTFTGMLQDRQKFVALKGADMFVLASRSENFSISVVEAAASGLPVIISNKVNIWKDLEEAGAAIVINCDVPELARGIEKLSEDSELRESMGKKGRELMRERYSWRGAVDNLEKVYRDVLLSRT